jgi:dopamine beta-monooxygenase
MSLGVNRYALPTKETFLLCKYFNINEIASLQTGLNPDTKYHAIEFETHTSHIGDNVALHHMSLLGCPVNYPSNKIKTEPFDCTDTPMPECNKFIVDTTPGQKSFKLPKETGFVWGSGETRIVLIQLHYHNPSATPGKYDSSDFTVSYSPKLRNYDTGTMVLGKDLPLINIPPRMFCYTIKSLCISECTSMMNGKVTVYGYLSHGHTVAKSIMSEFRDKDGKLLTTLGERHYMEHNQTLRFIKPMIDIEPGFQATTTCAYTTTETNAVTHGGSGPNDEMCFNYIYYYPKDNGLSYCMGSGTPLSCIINNIK